jgi:hypothetical protein
MIYFTSYTERGLVSSLIPCNDNNEPLTSVKDEPNDPSLPKLFFHVSGSLNFDSSHALLVLSVTAPKEQIQAFRTVSLFQCRDGPTGDT